jgi:hypothetical protein
MLPRFHRQKPPFQGSIGYLCFGKYDSLPPFAMWTAFPSSDYYGGSDAPFVSPTDC